VSLKSGLDGVRCEAEAVDGLELDGDGEGGSGGELLADGEGVFEPGGW
jgi:hypothetical protein